MPQIGDTFLDRLLNLTSRSEDVAFRQNLAVDYRKASEAMIPLQQSVAYDESILTQLTASHGAGKATDAATVHAEIENACAEGRKLVGQMGEIYQIISRNITPSTQLFTLTTPPTTRNLRSLNTSRILILGIVLLIGLTDRNRTLRRSSPRDAGDR